MMEKKNIDLYNTGYADEPLFNGNYTRDTAVSVYEKYAEAAKVIYNAILVKKAKKKK